MRHRSKHTLFGRQNTINHNNSYSPTQKDNTRTSSTFTLGKNSQLTKNNNKLHSKSTYFYRWGSSSKLSSSLSYVVPSVCGLALLVGGIVAINPLINQNQAYAVTGGGSVENIGDTNSASITITPDATENVNAIYDRTAYSSHTVKLAGSSIKGYTLSISYASGSTALENAENTGATIGGANNKTGNDLDNNTWGYGWSDTISTDNGTLTYKTMPVVSTPATLKTSGNTNLPNSTLDVTGKLVFAAKFGTGAAVGHYTTNVLVSLAVEPEEVAKIFGGITRMDEMTKDICTAASAGDTAQLIDDRDSISRKYWVTKLADNNCWMTQNLDYNLSSGTYYDPGDYYYNGSDGKHMQDATGCGSNINLSNCNNLFSTSGDNHYHIGNYYSFANRNDVCPTGWRVPTSGGDRGEYGRDYEALITAYGWKSASPSATTMNNGKGIYGEPLYFVYGGLSSTSAVSSAGSNGYYLSSTVWENGGGYMANLLITNNVTPVSSFSTGSLMPVRCMFPTV